MNENNSEKSQDVYSRTAGTYSRLGEPYLEAISKGSPPELPDFIKLLPSHADVLDVGTAGGRDAKVFADAGMHVTGVDTVDVFLGKARKDVPNATFIKMDMRALDFPEKSLDGIYANASLIHLKKDEVPPVLENFYRMLRQGGKLHIRVKEGEGEREVAEKLSQNEKRFFAFYTQIELEQLITAARFKILRSRIIPDDFGRSDLKWVSVWGEK